MIQKKICLVGAYAVGKTSLIARYVRSIFSEEYLTSIGVKVDKKALTLEGRDVTLLIWDLVGSDRFGPVEISYLRGAAGYLLVADGTRRATLDTAVALQQRMVATLGDVPFVFLMNKSDLLPQWEVSDSELDEFAAKGWRIQRTSAKSGEGVEGAFLQLAGAILAAP